MLRARAGIYVGPGSTQLTMAGCRLQENTSPNAAQLGMRSSGSLTMHNSSLVLAGPGVQVRQRARGARGLAAGPLSFQRRSLKPLGSALHTRPPSETLLPHPA
jgi:hypothetical protein